MRVLNRFKKNLSLIGPPGSGKGSYGKHIARALQLPILTVSDLIRHFRPDLYLSSGELIDDRIVSDMVLQKVLESSKDGYILDGFPRTLKQAVIMKEKWPLSCHVQAAITLAVPDSICEMKLLGRRVCSKCGENYNVNNVQWNEWKLPPILPKRQCVPQCDPNQDWITREDDTPELVKYRLKVYQENMDPILEYFETQNRLLTLQPFHGYDELPKLVDSVQTWLKHLDEEEETEQQEATSETNSSAL
jgi:adenylate kinase